MLNRLRDKSYETTATTATGYGIPKDQDVRKQREQAVRDAAELFGCVRVTASEPDVRSVLLRRSLPTGAVDSNFHRNEIDEQV